MCKCVNFMYKIIERMCEVMCYIFCKNFFDVVRYENFDYKFILFVSLIIYIFCCIMNVCIKKSLYF